MTTEARLRHALEAIASQCERLAAGGEPQNNVPEFCRAVLAGHDVTLAGMDAWLAQHCAEGAVTP